MMSNNEQLRYKRGDTLFREGEDARHMFIITSGRVQVACEGKDGRRHLIGQRGAGECCGETSCLSHKPRNSTVTCVSDEGCEVMCVSREDFLALVRGSWDVAQDLIEVSERHKKEKERRVNFVRTRDEVGGEDEDDG
jgi:CRP/FNR family cyclic AMP-dependent transcriptional regulator